MLNSIKDPLKDKAPFIWHLPRIKEREVDRLVKITNCLPATARILSARGLNSISELRSFLNPDVKEIKDPKFIKDLDLASERISQAVIQQEKILIFGDYDADGITSTSLVYTFLKKYNPNVQSYLPHREREGYGLKKFHIEDFVKLGIKLLITVDCGISNHEAVKAALDNNIEVIITDHHKTGEKLPKAYAVVNPQREDCNSELENMAGVGLAFYLLIAIRKKLRKKEFWKKYPEPSLIEETDLVALGTIADLVPLTGTNRILVNAGIKTIRKRARAGIRALCRLSDLKEEEISSEDIAFRLAPRINAAGRMDHPDLAFKLLISKDLEEAMPYAVKLDQLNKKRQEEEKDILKSIEALIEKKPELLKKPALILEDERWPVGIIGIIASKLSKLYNKPVIIISKNEKTASASARSISGLDIYMLIKECSELLEQHGGHSMAAGFTIKTENIQAFKECFFKLSDSYLDIINSPHKIYLDTEVELKELNISLLKELERLEPFGMSNIEPLFLVRKIEVVSSFPLGREGLHRKLTVRQRNHQHSYTIPALIFGLGKDTILPRQLEVCIFKLKREWGKKEGIQLNIEAWY